MLAEIAAKECKGLPLALITIGRAMAGKSTLQEWERAIQMLKTYPSKFSDNDLINLWIGEGFLDEFDNLHEARNQGHNIIEHLKVACLFESDEDNRIKMHDVIRDMALWLTSDYCGNKNKVVVEEDGTLEAQQILKWKEAKQISLGCKCGKTRYTSILSQSDNFNFWKCYSEDISL
ncbi:probable disease resistance protein At5g63020 [Vitis riparia]|uniref:probable disease resistance protein At5g63020 n=1 Tax=Vitis riparia TaxID=96939 RepID=UPI00155B2B30|nr:probable disease resistance protein At5g63020 [Vitis riparia]